MILLTGDTHGVLERILQIDDSNMTKKDILIVCGDFGYVWNEESFFHALDEIGSKNFQLAFIDGNHENFNLLKDIEKEIECFGARAGLLPNNIIHLQRGEVYNIENKIIGVCGGANSTDTQYRTENVDWWRAEEITPEQADKLIYNINTYHHGNVDVMLTHDCPTEALQLLGAFYPSVYSWMLDENPSRKQLDKIANAVTARQWFFGHHHLDLRLGSKYRALYTDIVEL